MVLERVRTGMSHGMPKHLGAMTAGIRSGRCGYRAEEGRESRGASAVHYCRSKAAGSSAERPEACQSPTDPRAPCTTVGVWSAERLEPAVAVRVGVPPSATRLRLLRRG